MRCMFVLWLLCMYVDGEYNSCGHEEEGERERGRGDRDVSL